MSPRDMATSEGHTPSPETGVSSNVRAQDGRNRRPSGCSLWVISGPHCA
jgi:hypothetical protein